LILLKILTLSQVRRGRDRMVLGFMVQYQQFLRCRVRLRKGSPARRAERYIQPEDREQ